MTKYLLTGGGIKNQETGAHIPIDEGNRHYQEYLEWLEEGNSPLMVQPSEFHKLVNDVWTLDTKAQTKANQEVLIQEKIRELAVDCLKSEGKLPADFETKKERGEKNNE